MKLFHGTSDLSAANILLNGFKINACNDYGKAIYFSDLMSWAKEYCPKHNGRIISACFTGKLLDLQNAMHFEIFKKLNNKFLDTEIKKIGFDALKDGHIIAIYRKGKIKSINII